MYVFVKFLSLSFTGSFVSEAQREDVCCGPKGKDIQSYILPLVAESEKEESSSLVMRLGVHSSDPSAFAFCLNH